MSWFVERTFVPHNTQKREEHNFMYVDYEYNNVKLRVSIFGDVKIQQYPIFRDRVGRYRINKKVVSGKRLVYFAHNPHLNIDDKTISVYQKNRNKYDIQLNNLYHK